MTTSRSERGRGAAGRDRPRADRSAGRTDRSATRAPIAPPAAPSIEPIVADRGAIVLLVACAALLAARAAGAFLPGAWGFDTLRFAPPWAGWALWAVAGLALMPPVMRGLTPRLAWFGDALARAPRGPALGLGAALAALVLLLPDRLWLMGDFLLRLGCTRGQIPASMVFPQAMPLDFLLHHDLPVALSRSQNLEPAIWERMLGAFEAALLGIASAGFARGLGLRGVAAAACAGTLAFTGLLGMFAGYGKAFVELTLITVASGAFAIRLVREGRGAWPLAAIVTVAMLCHRSALALLVVVAAAGVTWALDPAWRARPRRALTLAALALPFAAAAALAPRMREAMKVTDARHLAPAGGGVAGALGAAFAPSHLGEIVQLVGQWAPLVFALPLLCVALAPALRVRRRELPVLAALAAPALAVLLFIHPRQGAFRDGDVFAPSLAALSLVSAALVGEALRGSAARAWIATAALFATLVPAVQGLALNHDVDRGLARVTARLEGPPAGKDEAAALLWAWVAERQLGLDRSDAAIAAFKRATDLAPSPRLFVEWAMAEEDRGRWAEARAVYFRVIERMPTLTEAWLGVGRNSMRLGDRKSGELAARRALELEPDLPAVQAFARAVMDTGATHGPR